MGLSTVERVQKNQRSCREETKNCSRVGVGVSDGVQHRRKGSKEPKELSGRNEKLLERWRRQWGKAPSKWFKRTKGAVGKKRKIARALASASAMGLSTVERVQKNQRSCREETKNYSSVGVGVGVGDGVRRSGRREAKGVCQFNPTED
jgi:hypothetical protein